MATLHFIHKYRRIVTFASAKLIFFSILPTNLSSVFPMHHQEFDEVLCYSVYTFSVSARFYEWKIWKSRDASHQLKISRTSLCVNTLIDKIKPIINYERLKMPMSDSRQHPLKRLNKNFSLNFAILYVNGNSVLSLRENEWDYYTVKPLSKSILCFTLGKWITLVRTENWFVISAKLKIILSLRLAEQAKTWCKRYIWVKK